MSKNIVVCYDGTNNEYGTHNTNIVKTFEALVRDDTQIAFYDPGVGTFPNLGRRLGRRIGIGLGLVFGYGIQTNIEDGYEYLMNNFKPGDKVFLFGFSRGAYTARALAGMIFQFGILREGNKNLIRYVSKMYFKKDKEKDFSVIKSFKKTFSNEYKPRTVPHFVGLWDTVGALGRNLKKQFPNFELNEDVKYGFQAIAIDEKRRPYKVILWDERGKKDNQVIEQVWFAGVHSEVGGGCSKDKCSLSDITFAWMMDKASAPKCGLKLKDNWQDGLNQYVGADIHALTFPWSIPMLQKKRVIEEIQRERISRAKIHQSVIDREIERDDYRPTLPDNKSIVSTDSYRSNA